MSRMFDRLLIVLVACTWLALPVLADEPGTPADKPAADAPKEADKPADAPKEADKPADAPKEADKPADAPKEAEAAKSPEESAADAAKAAATDVMTKFLDAVKAKKWDVAKKYIHPKTLMAIADVKKRKGVEDHRMALWAKVGDFYITAAELAEPTDTAKGGLVFSSTESIFRVEDKGVEDGVHVAYLVLPVGGKMWVTDRKENGENDFPASTLPAAFKGYFDGEFTLPAGAGAPDAPAKKGK